MDSNNWQSFLKGCLDILRNGDSKYDGLKAINEFITLITLKLVENRISDEVVNNYQMNDNNIKIGIDCTFTYLYNNYCKVPEKEKIIKASELYDLLYNSRRVFDIEQTLDDNCRVVSENRTRNNKKECIIVRFNKHTDSLCKLTDNINDITTLTSFTPNHCFDIQELIIKIHETFDGVDMDHFNYDAFGNAYEKMMTDELGNSSKRNGQYFTRRDVIGLIIDELDVKSTDICYDPGSGTGGFIIGFGKKYKNDKNFIENNIYGQEYLYEVYKTLNFNILANNMDGMLKNITRGDSIRNFDYHSKILNKFDVVAANPPFGISIDKCHSDYPINKIKDSVALFLQHIYFSLKDGGRAGVIIDRGILNNATDVKISKTGKQSNAWERDLRKFLLEKTNIYKIINLPTGIFKHTKFSTSIIFFVKGIPTKEIKYIEGYFKDEDKGNSSKPMYLGEEKIVKIEDIIKNKYSLKYDDYFKVKEINENNELWIKLGEVCEMYPTTKYCTSIGNITGKYRFYSSSQKDKLYLDSFEINKESIIIGNGGTANVHYDNQFTPSKHVTACYLKCNIKNITIKFIYWYFRININIIENDFNGGGLKWLNREKISQFKIPNLPLQHQEEIVDFLDNIYKTNKIEDTVKYMKDKPIFNLLISKKYNTFKDVIIFNQKRMLFILSELKNIPKMKNIQIQSIFNSLTLGVEKQKLGDICNLNRGKILTIPKIIKGDYPVIGGGQKPMGYHNQYNKNEECILMSSSGSYAGYLSKYKEKVWASDCFSIEPKNNKINKNYLWYYLKSNQENIYKLQHGNCQPHISTTDMETFLIPIPSLEIQEKIVKKIDDLNLETSHYNQYATMLQLELDNILEVINNITLSSDTDYEQNLDENINYENNIDEQLENSVSEQLENSVSEETVEKKIKYKVIEINETDYYLIGDKVYTIKNNKKNKLFGYYKDKKFSKNKKESKSIKI